MIGDDNKKDIFCRIKKGKDVKHAWVPEDIANFGANLIITKKDGKIDRGWYIIRINRDRTRLCSQDDLEDEPKRLVA